MHSPSQLALRAAILVAIIAGGALLSGIAAFWWISVGVVIGASGLLAWIAIRFAQDTARAQLGSDELRRLNETLEAQVEARTSDFRESNARLRSIIESAVDGIIVIDEHGQIESFNPGAERLFGYPESEVLGRNVSMLMPSPYHEEHDGYLNRYLTTGTAKIIGTGPRGNRPPQGRHDVPPSSVGRRAHRRGESDALRASCTIWRRASAMEKQLRERASLAKVGEMAAAIAHEVKNPLAGVRGAIQVFRSRLSSDSGDVPILIEIVTRIDALDHLMKDLLLFARPPQPCRIQIEVVPLIAMTADLICQDPSLRGISVEIDCV